MKNYNISDSRGAYSPMTEKQTYVVSGALLKCSFGVVPSYLNLKISHGSFVDERAQCNIGDRQVSDNITTFGACAADSQPCKPVFKQDWLGGKTDVIIGDKAALVSKCYLQCMRTGQVTIVNDGQIARKLSQKDIDFSRISQETYALDKETADLLARVYRNLRNSYIPKVESNQGSNQLFFALIAGTVYGDGSMLNKVGWKFTADIPWSDKKRMLMDYGGLTEREYNNLKKGLNEQHKNCSEKGTPDLVHQFATSATIMNQGALKDSAGILAGIIYSPGSGALSIGTTGLGAVRNFNPPPPFGAFFNADNHAGWMGDVRGTNGAKPSMDAADYKSDIDAVNITSRMTEASDLRDVFAAYYEDLKSGKTTREAEFLRKQGNGNERVGLNNIKNLLSDQEDNPYAQKFIMKLENPDNKLD